MTAKSHISTSISGGLNGNKKYAQNGTLWSTPCIAGYEGPYCKPC